MATKRRTDERLNRLTSLTETNSQQIQDLRFSIASLIRRSGQKQEEFEHLLIEVRRIGAENCKILDQLLIHKSR